jgi:hypothetical protein
MVLGEDCATPSWFEARKSSHLTMRADGNPERVQ